MAEQVDLLLQGGTVATMDEGYQVYEEGAVAIRDGVIVAVGPAARLTAAYDAAEEVDCAGQMIMPGLVNAHTHVPMTLFRGLNDDLRLDVWLGYLMPLEREFVSPEFVRLGTRLGAAEMIRSGVTTFADMYYFEDDIAEETAAIGMRALLGQTILIFPAPDAATYEDGLIICRRFIERWRDHPLIQPAVAPHAWYTATPQMLRACADLARAYDVPIHTHIAETRFELENCRETHHMRTVPWNAQNSILDTKLLAAHCVHIDSDEMFALREAGAGVAHCPSSNLKLASGIAPVAEMLEMGLNVGVGTDGPASNNDLDMVEETRLAALLAKTAANDPTVLPARQAVAAATIGGARALHMAEKIGSLEPGKEADVIVVDMDPVHNRPHFHNHEEAIYSRLIYAAKAPDVAHVICNGRWLMRDRELLTIDEKATLAAAAQVASEIDAFVLERESSPYNKLVILAGVERQESFEVQVKVPIADAEPIRRQLEDGTIEVTRRSHYQQYDTYFFFSGDDPDAARLRYREDEFVNEETGVSQVRARLTLIGEEERQQFPNAVMLSRSRFLAAADRTLRFYREYFNPEREVEVVKERKRWHILYHGTDFAVNLDQVQRPNFPGYFLEIKSRTWSRTDAERKARLIAELLELFGVDPDKAEPQDYPELAETKMN